MFVCEDCGRIFDEEDVLYWKEDRGKYGEDTCFEEMCGCPSCKGAFFELKNCGICGAIIKESDWDICEECINKNKSLEVAKQIGETKKEQVELNEFLTFCFEPKEIEYILYKYIDSLSQGDKQDLINQYCEDDISCYVEEVIKRARKKDCLFKR